MADLKLPKLPDRTLAKLTISLLPETKAALDDYVLLYEKRYGRTESASDLAAAIIGQFLAADRGFQKARSEIQRADRTST